MEDLWDINVASKASSATVGLIAKEDASDRVPRSGRRFCFSNFHHCPDFSATPHRSAFHRKRQLGWDIFNAFVRQLNAVAQKNQISRFRHDATS
jgi:hypothetical protein